MDLFGFAVKMFFEALARAKKIWRETIIESKKAPKSRQLLFDAYSHGNICFRLNATATTTTTTRSKGSSLPVY